MALEPAYLLRACLPLMPGANAWLVGKLANHVFENRAKLSRIYCYLNLCFGIRLSLIFS